MNWDNPPAPLFDGNGVVSRGLVAVGMTGTMDATGIPHIARELLTMRHELSALLMGE